MISVTKEVEKLFFKLNPVPPDLHLGTKLNPLHVLELSRFFSMLNLKNEQIFLASFSDPVLPNYLLTDQFFYFNHQKKPERAAVSEFKTEIVHGIFPENEILLVENCIAVITGKKQEKLKTIDNFIDKYKHLLDEEEKNYENKSLFFDRKYLEMLQHEADELVHLCQELNDDAHFVQSTNLVFKNTDEATDGYKAEHLLIFDLIKAYNSVLENENEKSRITLAYFFERLQGKDMAKDITIQRLNEMTTNQTFLSNIEKIKSAQYIRPIKEYSDEYLLPSILYRIQHPLFIKSGNLIYRFASMVVKADNTISDKEKVALKLILEKTSQPKINKEGVISKDIPADDNLEKVMSELNELIGLEEVKKSITELVNLLKVQKIRSEKGLENVEGSLHAVFMGSPGTGKTTVARLLGRLYKHLGYLEKGHVIETDRAGLIAGFVGQTAIQVNEIINQSKGGVLFIDEAYSLTPPDGGRDFGFEAVDILIKRMEDLRNELVVIVAGYTEPMKLFVESNPGLRSRFNRFYAFNHFLPVQLLQIFESFCKKSDFKITGDASEKLLDTFEMLYDKRDDGFGNARVVRNLFERCIQIQANRIVNIKELTMEVLQTLDEADIPEPKNTVQQVYFTTMTD